MKIIVQSMEHSELGASSAHRWMQCPGSLTVKGGGDSKYAKMGRVAHEVAYKCLKMGRNPGYWVGMVAEGDDCDGVVFTQDMADSVKVYVEYVRNLEPSPTDDNLEKQMLLDHLPRGPGGTVDFHTWIGGTLHIVDYKSGSVPQNPGHNPQLMTYALAAAKHHQRRPDSVVLHVVQPKAEGAARWTVPKGYGEEFYWHMLAASEKADRVLSTGTASNTDHKEGDWCRWCPKMATCPLKVTKALAVHGESVPPAELTDTQLSRVLSVASDLRRFLKEAEGHARATLEAGGQVPGYELAPPRRKKVWSVDADRVLGYLATRGVSLTTPTPVAALRAVKDLPDDFWHWEDGGAPRLVKIESEFTKEDA